jgi:hypothetical protein
MGPKLRYLTVAVWKQFAASHKRMQRARRTAKLENKKQTLTVRSRVRRKRSLAEIKPGADTASTTTGTPSVGCSMRTSTSPSITNHAFATASPDENSTVPCSIHDMHVRASAAVGSKSIGNRKCLQQHAYFRVRFVRHPAG